VGNASLGLIILCKACPNSVLKWIGVIILLFILCYVVERALTKINTSLPHDVAIALGGVQLLALLPSISSNWPRVEQNFIDELRLGFVGTRMLSCIVFLG
jgi:hypothetical protein